MKKVFFAASFGIALLVGAVVTLSSCSDAEEVMNPEKQVVYAPVSVQVSGFSVSMEDFPGTRAAVDPSSYQYVKRITLAFYDSDGTEIQKSTQIKNNASTYTTFGQFSCSLPVGNYTLVAVAYDFFDGDDFALTSSTVAAFSSERVRETFCATQSVTITNATPLNLSVTLNRINTKLGIYSTDLCPSSAATLRTTYSAACKGFNPTTGLATNTNGFSVENMITPSANGKVEIGNCAFIATDQQTMDITLEVLDGSNNVLCTKVVPNVPLRRNRITVLEGQLFTPSSPSTASFTIETQWLDDYTVTF